MFNVTAAWDHAAADAVQVEWARRAWNDLKAFSTGGTYLNFLTEEEGPERTAAALGTAIERLAAIKGTWDPGNMFRANRNVTPVLGARKAGGRSLVLP